MSQQTPDAWVAVVRMDLPNRTLRVEYTALDMAVRPISEVPQGCYPCGRQTASWSRGSRPSPARGALQRCWAPDTRPSVQFQGSPPLGQMNGTLTWVIKQGGALHACSKVVTSLLAGSTPLFIVWPKVVCFPKRTAGATTKRASNARTDNTHNMSPLVGSRVLRFQSYYKP